MTSLLRISAGGGSGGGGGGGGGSSSISAGQGGSGKSLEVWSTGSGPEGGDWKEAKRIKQGAQLEDINVVSPQRLMQVASIKMVHDIVSARTLIPFSSLKDFMKRVPSLGKSRAIIFSNAGIGKCCHVLYTLPFAGICKGSSILQI